MTSNFNHRLRIMESMLIVCLSLKMAYHASKKGKRVGKDGEGVLACCEKCSQDSVELAGLCKLLFFTL